MVRLPVQFGLCLVADVLTTTQIERARTAPYRAAADDIEQGREQPRFGLDYGDSNQRVWNVLARDPIFIELVEHPAALRLIRAVIGWPVLRGNLSANIVGPGAEESMLHADQIFVPEPWPAAPQGRAGDPGDRIGHAAATARVQDRGPGSRLRSLADVTPYRAISSFRD